MYSNYTAHRFIIKILLKDKTICSRNVLNTKLSIVHASAICQHTDSSQNKLSRDVSRKV